MLTTVIATIGLAGGWLMPGSPASPPDALRLGFIPLALAFAAAEAFVVMYQFRKEQYAFGLAELPLALGLYFSSWPTVLLGRLVGSAMALVLVRKQRPMKLAFNLAAFTIETSTAFAVFNLFAGRRGADLRPALVAMAGIILGVLIVTALVLTVIGLHEGHQPTSKTVVSLVGGNTIVAAMNATLALLVIAVVSVNRSTVWLLLLVAAVLYTGYRSYVRLRQKHEDLELLYDFTRRTGRALHVDSAMRELLGQVRAVLRADVAMIVVRSSATEESLIQTSLGADDRLEITPVTRNALWQRIERDGASLLAPAPIRDDVLREELAEYGAIDAVVAPLRRGDGSLLGLMLAANRLGEHRTFTAEDLKLFDALANHAAVSLENRHLIERLRAEATDKEHQALHDALTGLPNRLLFQDRIALALAADHDEGAKVAVMLLDLDRFKEVNDTLGHHNGDLLLQEIGDRLRSILRAGDTVARLGGDEFAVLLPDLAGEEAA
ncbi:MAG: diguanylate cyclase/phosphodiesterase & domain with sensor(s), partial [Actinomycetia bacterium]|nr:diguanylate cyclase/phosphodiesterase & domain with sensor(s) [Actinomycetes bacterium]